MKTKNACILLLAALALTACEYDDSALWEQVNQNTERIAALEAWQAETNTNIQSLQTLLNTTDHITAVTPVMENEVEVGYTISFLNSDPVTIYHGKKGDEGDTPQIGVMQGEDGNWYWTLNGEPLTDGGKPIQANGDKGDTGPEGASAPVPQLETGVNLTVSEDSKGAAIVDEAIYLSVDKGKTWTRVSGTDGDSFFSKVDTSDPTCVTFTLADGTTTFSVPRYTGIKLNFDTEAVHLGYGDTLPVNFTAEGSDQFTTDNLFIIAPDGWKAEVTLPTRAATEFILNVTAPANATSGAAEGEILMMLDNQQGNTTIGRIKVDCKSTNLLRNNVTAGALATAIGNRTNLTSITVTSGTLNEADWAAVRKNYAALRYLDLEGATYEGTDKDNLTWGSAASLLTVQLPQGITALGEYAFRSSSALTTVTLPETLTSIGNYAFLRCSALTSITLPDGVTTIGTSAFSNCTALTSIDLPDGVKSIEPYTFSNCTSLTSITLPDGVTTILDHAFQSCIRLTSIDLPDGLKSIDGYAFMNCEALTSIDLPDGVTTIGNAAFANCSSLTSIDLPDGVTTIGNSVFYNCSALKSITLPEGVTTIGSTAFSNCSSLTSIDLPDGVTTIGPNAFYNCSALTSIDLPDGLKSIEMYTFNNCTALKSITLPKELTTIGDYAFRDCTSLTSIDLPDGLTSIGYMAFLNCSAMTSITLPDKVTTIEGYAFNNCSALKSITLPDGLESIGNATFYNCTSLTSITLPEGLTSIGNSAFVKCTSLTTVTCQATGVPNLGVDAFKDCSKLANIYVPAGSVDDYKAATGWSAYSTKIQAIQ